MKIIRWILLLPAAVVGAGIIAAIARLIGNWFSPVDSFGIMGLLYEFGYSVMLGAMFVLIGVTVAPDYKKITSIVLTTLGVAFCIVSLLIQLFVIQVVDWQIIISCIAVAIGCIVGAYETDDFLEKSESKL